MQCVWQQLLQQQDEAVHAAAWAGEKCAYTKGEPAHAREKQAWRGCCCNQAIRWRSRTHLEGVLVHSEARLLRVQAGLVEYFSTVDVANTCKRSNIQQQRGFTRKDTDTDTDTDIRAAALQVRWRCRQGANGAWLTAHNGNLPCHSTTTAQHVTATHLPLLSGP